uniref:Uncharacterized protein n=1 Tax=Arundo donax TaxID=35708 RepID=A0A0A8XX07_ARUDO
MDYRFCAHEFLCLQDRRQRLLTDLVRRGERPPAGLIVKPGEWLRLFLIFFFEISHWSRDLKRRVTESNDWARTRCQ